MRRRAHSVRPVLPARGKRRPRFAPMSYTVSPAATYFRIALCRCDSAVPKQISQMLIGGDANAIARGESAKDRPGFGLAPPCQHHARFRKLSNGGHKVFEFLFRLAGDRQSVAARRATTINEVPIGRWCPRLNHEASRFRSPVSNSFKTGTTRNSLEVRFRAASEPDSFPRPLIFRTSQTRGKIKVMN